MKIVAHYYGRVNTFNSPPHPSYITLKDARTGQTVDTDAASQKLLEQGIDHDGCEFEIIIQESEDGKINATLAKLNPNSINPPVCYEI